MFLGYEKKCIRSKNSVKKKLYLKDFYGVICKVRTLGEGRDGSAKSVLTSMGEGKEFQLEACARKIKNRKIIFVTK